MGHKFLNDSINNTECSNQGGSIRSDNVLMGGCSATPQKGEPRPDLWTSPENLSWYVVRCRVSRLLPSYIKPNSTLSLCAQHKLLVDEGSLFWSKRMRNGWDLTNARASEALFRIYSYFSLGYLFLSFYLWQTVENCNTWSKNGQFLHFLRPVSDFVTPLDNHIILHGWWLLPLSNQPPLTLTNEQFWTFFAKLAIPHICS